MPLALATLCGMPPKRRTADVLDQAGLRLRCAMDVLHMEKLETFAAFIGVQPTTLSNWLNGARLVDVIATTRLFRKTGIGPDWIFAGSVAGVPYQLGEELQAAAAKRHAVLHGAVAEWPMVAERRARPPARAPDRRPRYLHEPANSPHSTN